MAERDQVIVVESDGSVRAEGDAAERVLRGRAGRYRLLADVPGLLVLRATAGRGAGEGDSPRVVMSGELVSRASVLEILSVLDEFRWRGDLTVFGPGAVRRLGVDQGVVMYAGSDDPADRLGEVLYRNGVLTHSQVDEVLRRSSPAKRFGQLVVEMGFLTREQLFGQLARQVEQIFNAVLVTPAGTFLFTLADESSEPPFYTVHLPLKGLLMEGVQRIDEMALFRERIPHDGLCPEALPAAAAMAFDDDGRAVLAACDGLHTIGDVARETGLGQFAAVKVVYGLLRQGAIRLGPGRLGTPAAVRRLVERFNGVLRDVFVAVADRNAAEDLRAMLESWIPATGYAPLLGTTVNGDGTIPVEEVSAAMAEAHTDEPVAALRQALHDLAAFALLAGTFFLPGDRGLELSRDVNQRLRQMDA